jgi:hypothetical protein
MSAPATSDDAFQTTGRFYAMVESLHKFDKQEVKGVLRTLLSTSERERCFIATYYRASGNAASLLELKQPRHFQAIAMLARSLFELAVDIKLIDLIADSPIKIREFTDVEKLRSAYKILRFKTANPNAAVDTAIYSSFVANNKSRIEAAKSSLWPTTKKLSHWSGLHMQQRAELVKSPFQEIYEVKYPMLSWYVHSGFTGVVNLNAESFTVLCGVAFQIATEVYRDLLLTMIREFRIAKADEKIEGKLEVAKYLPFTDTPEQVETVIRHFTK